MSKRRLLISVAHPDDESFGYGGLIARYLDEGAEVYVIVATNGDVGTISPEMLDGYKSIRELRLAELDCAAATLGVTQLFKFGYKDSGMVGTQDNMDPNCLWYVWQDRPEEVTQRVVEVIRQIKPQVVLTFNKYGGYGHPDHIAIQRATTEAFHQAGDPSFATGDLPPYRPQKLYYSSIPSSMVRLGIWLTRLRRQDPRRMGRNNDVNLVAILDHVEPTHTKVDISRYLDDWDAASRCHASQGGGGGGWFPRWLRKFLRTKQGFTRDYPPPQQDRVDENDLFAGVNLDEPVPERAQ